MRRIHKMVNISWFWQWKLSMWWWWKWSSSYHDEHLYMWTLSLWWTFEWTSSSGWTCRWTSCWWWTSRWTLSSGFTSRWTSSQSSGSLTAAPRRRLASSRQRFWGDLCDKNPHHHLKIVIRQLDQHQIEIYNFPPSELDPEVGISINRMRVTSLYPTLPSWL